VTADGAGDEGPVAGALCEGEIDPDPALDDPLCELATDEGPDEALAGLLCDDVLAPPLMPAVVVWDVLSVTKAAEELPKTEPCDEEAGLAATVDPA